MSIRPWVKNDRPKTMVDRRSMTMSPTELVAMLESTRPLRYSEMESGVAKILRKFRDHTSSKKAIVTPCMTRIKKSQRRTAPRRIGMKLNPAEAKVLRYFVMNPQSTMSTDTQTNSGKTRETLPRMS